MHALLPTALAASVLVPMVHGVLNKAVNAADDAQIHLYPFMTPDCTGQPFTSPYEMKQGQCVNMNQAHSLRPRFRSDHSDWVNEINNLQMQCKLETFSDFGCPEDKKIEKYEQNRSGELPKHLNSCLTPQSQKTTGKGARDDAGSKDNEASNGFFSAKFVCGKPENPKDFCTRTIKHTSWSIDSTYGAPHSDVKTATYTGSLVISAKSSATAEKRFKPGRESKGVWMHHPWSQSLLCYLCYPKEELDYRKVECRAGHSFPANCGPAPVLDSKVKPKMPVATMASKAPTTPQDHAHADDLSASDSDSEPDEGDIGLQQKGSWHTPVKFQHPFLDGKDACADAEWEKRGHVGKDYIKIQKVHICDDKDRKDSQWIGLPKTNVGALHDSAKASTKPRHDQL